jgi:glucokinase
MGLTVGVDVGGTKIAAGVVDDAGRLVATRRRLTPATDAAAVVRTISDVVVELRGQHDVQAVGIGAAAFIDKARATVLFAPNLAWHDMPLRAEVERMVRLPTVVENDANAAAWGEFRFGAGAGADVDDMLLVTVGTGVGGGLVIDGTLYRGGFGVAAEIGHLGMVPGGHLCGCGNRGCLEQYASGRALVREAREVAATNSPQAAGILDLAGGQVSAITGPILTKAAASGDGLAVELLGEVGRWLGEGIASLAAVLDPTMVVLGGGVSEAGSLLLDPALAAFRQSLTGRRHRPELTLALARLGNTAGLIGAADLARDGADG